jgi:hypothetical protein
VDWSPGILDLWLGVFEAQSSLCELSVTLHPFCKALSTHLLVVLGDTVDPFAGQIRA